MAILTVYTCNNPSSPTSTTGETKLYPGTSSGVSYPEPSAITWGLQDISSSDAGRTQDGYMYKQRIAQKVKLTLSFNGVNQTTAAAILTAFNNEYVKVQYPDAMAGSTQTKVFYVGDRSAPVYMYTNNKKIYQNISFDIIER